MTEKRIRSKLLTVWTTEAEREQINQLASIRDQTVSEFVRERLLSAPAWHLKIVENGTVITAGSSVAS